MKKNSAFILFCSIILFSCSKRADETVYPQSTTASSENSVAINTVTTWDVLPADLKDAKPVNQGGANKTPVRSFGPYGSFDGNTFSGFPPQNSKVYAVGINGNGGGVTRLIIWYKTSDGKIFYNSAGTSVTFEVRRFDDDEFIRYLQVYSSSIINKLTFITNKKVFTYGGNGGTLHDIASPGTELRGFWGRYNTYITQLNLVVYARPLHLMPGSDGRDVAVAADGTVYLTNNSALIYRFDDAGNSWVRLVGAGSRIAANSNRVCLANTNGKIYELYGSAWVQFPGGNAKDIAINTDGKIWMIDNSGNTYTYNGTSWILVSSFSSSSSIFWPSRIDAGAGQVWMLDGAGELGSLGTLYKWTGSSWQSKIHVNANHLSVSSDGVVWLAGEDGVYTYDGTNLVKLYNDPYVIDVNNNRICLINIFGYILSGTY